MHCDSFSARSTFSLSLSAFTLTFISLTLLSNITFSFLSASILFWQLSICRFISSSLSASALSVRLFSSSESMIPGLRILPSAFSPTLWLFSLSKALLTETSSAPVSLRLISLLIISSSLPLIGTPPCLIHIVFSNIPQDISKIAFPGSFTEYSGMRSPVTVSKASILSPLFVLPNFLTISISLAPSEKTIEPEHAEPSQGLALSLSVNPVLLLCFWNP